MTSAPIAGLRISTSGPTGPDETTSDTVEPGATSVPAAGLCRRIRPASTSSESSALRGPAASVAVASAASASASVLPTRSGTVTPEPSSSTVTVKLCVAVPPSPSSTTIVTSCAPSCPGAGVQVTVPSTGSITIPSGASPSVNSSSPPSASSTVGR